MGNTFPSSQVTGSNAPANFTSALDKALVQKAATGFFTDNTLGAKFIGAKTVSIPDIALDGLGDYNRATGYTGGDATIARTVYTMTMDRGRSFMIDRMDNDEQAVADLIGGVSGEFVRTKVAPEMDAYVISKLAAKAIAKSHTVSVGGSSTLAADCYRMFSDARAAVEEAVGYDGQELVAFVDPTFIKALETSTALSRNLVVNDFAHGGINRKVKTLDGVALIPVDSKRMYAEFEFYDGVTAGETDGGFVPKRTTVSTTTTVNHAGLIICPKGIGGLVKKTEQLRIFTPEQNIDADAWKINYRVYYDFFIKKSYENAIYAYTYTETVT